MTYRPPCLATPPGYWGELPARCAQPRGHPGDHSTATTPIGMGWHAQPTTWPNSDDAPDEETTAA